MSQSLSRLNALFSEAFRQLDPNCPVPEIEISFYPYARVNHKIRRRSRRIYVRLSDIFKNAPIDVHRAIAFILVARLLSKRIPQPYERVYRDYACSPQVLNRTLSIARRRSRKVVSSAQGKVYDLDKIFQRLNRTYFDGKLEKPTLMWSQRRARSFLGHYDDKHDTIVISKALDTRNFRKWFVEYVLYHEMLHIKHPARFINGRRYYHTKAFLNEEQRFPYYEEAQHQLDVIARQQRIPYTRAA